MERSEHKLYGRAYPWHRRCQGLIRPPLSRRTKTILNVAKDLAQTWEEQGKDCTWCLRHQVQVLIKMSEKLLNVQEVCQYLGISEVDLRQLVDRGEIPAYRLGGTILRFRKDQIERIKGRGTPKVIKLEEETQTSVRISPLERFRDFLYFNDFYIISAIIVIVLLVVIFFY